MEKNVLLDNIAAIYKIEEDFDSVLLNYNLKVISFYFKGKIFLELGTSGLSTKLLLPYASCIDVVEASKVNIEKAKQMVDNNCITFYLSLWEKFNYPVQKYTDIIWFGGMEHIEAPEKILQRLRTALVKKGRLHIVVPNALSLHRRLGTYMKLIKEPHELSERDKKFGHVKVYDRFQVTQLLIEVGYHVFAWEGIFLKPLPNAKMLLLYKENPKLIDALYKIGKELPDYCAEIYICAENSE